MKQHYSLKRRLISYISIFSVILGCVLILAAYRISLRELNEILDAQMVYLAERVALNVHPIQSHFDSHEHYHEEDLFIDVWAYVDKTDEVHDQHLLVGKKENAGFYWHENGDGEWVTYILPTTEYQIQISQQLKVRKLLALELAGSMFLPYLLILPLAILGLVFIISRNLKPLDDMKSELSQRDPSDLALINNSAYPIELVPTINEMNDLFERISVSQQEQKQFVADAAHELRTPITALNLQSKILIRQFPEDRNLINLAKGLARIQHLVSQLLALAKQDNALNHEESMTNFSLNEVAVQCIEQLMNLAMEKEIDMGFIRNELVQIQSIEHSVHSIIYNLLDNAIKYTPNNGVINMSIYQSDPDHVTLLIEDSGQGLTTEQYTLVLKRFYRVHHHLTVGSGLGLPIVDKAIQQLGGSFNLSRSVELGGLSATVKLPLRLQHKA
ncbi:two-component system OmpR family sensor kinase/two-component system sensor histidine kinase QseC [Acinetobacter calcoaceticus]|uniref:histidine kinase n=1 Tax=Acinetobacter calcoaceticus TaxID=471 RepID=A0A4R1XZT0_ACICA|nr:two-component system OmpR family sensor kinase/two-component system sensor histidine kinase QseC [Acinetobacter calcoaceticus]